MKVYLDVCCLNRPFDDYAQDRVRLESEAVLTILDYTQSRKWVLIGSEVIDIEISKIPDNDRKCKVKILIDMKQKFITVNDDIENRPKELEKLGFKSFDALHIVCAEKSEADILLTTDDNFLSKASQNRNMLKVRVENPLKWLMEVIEK
ncbi:MAG: type II toxin-antitoxin system VapC family toxin [Deltaproteobacteria bacterium]|nr:type II toxin-antitoxin system VapC family toxin [Deltaproteobacteria bacterium]